MKKFYVTIPKPCHENWEQMTLSEKGRFCGSCQKTVIDFTNRSDRELATFFKKPAGAVCGRFQSHQLNRPVIVPKKRIPWFKYVFTIAWPAFVLFVTSCGTKERTPKKVIPAVTQPIKHNALAAAEAATVSTVVAATDHTQLKPVSKEDTVMQKEPEIGDSYAIAEPAIMGEMIAIDATQTVDTVFKEALSKLLDTVTVVGFGKRTRTLCGYYIQKLEAEYLTPPLSKEKETIQYSVYPNPVHAGALLTIDLTKTEILPKAITLLTATGQQVHSHSVTAIEKGGKIAIPIPYIVAAGMYYIQVAYESGETKMATVMISR